MKRALILITPFMVLPLAHALGATAAIAQLPEPATPDLLVHYDLSGPRFGVTMFTGDIAEQRNAIDKSRFMSQFGWQWESRLSSTQTGHQALIEWVALAGGVEQDELNVSLGALAGYRHRSGVELGAGPNISWNSEQTEATTSMIVATGYTLPVGGLSLPTNLAMSFSRGGPRLTLLLGWIVGR